MSVCSVGVCAVGEALAQSRMDEGWLHGWEDKAWPLSPRTGQMGTQGVKVHGWWAGAVLGRSQSPREMDRVWALPSCEQDAWWQSWQENCRGMNLPQRILVKEIIGKRDFDKLQILKMIKESLSSSVI